MRLPATGWEAGFSTVRLAASEGSAATGARGTCSSSRLTPVALALFTLWPLRIAIYGENLFRTGGTDWGPGDRIFGGLLYFAFAWSAVLLVVGVRSVHGWSWARSLATVGLAAALPVLVVLATIL